MRPFRGGNHIGSDSLINIVVIHTRFWFSRYEAQRDVSKGFTCGGPKRRKEIK